MKRLLLLVAMMLLVGSVSSNVRLVKASGAGYLGMYYNLPNIHPDMQGAVTGVVTGLVQNVLPITLTAIGSSYINQFDWWDNQYFVFSRVDPSLVFGNSWFPVNQGLPGDPYFFAVHWVAILTAPTEEDYNFQMGSDDDSWLFIDGNLVLDLGGVHALASTAGSVHLTSGYHTLDIYYAERHTVEAGFNFEFIPPPELEICPPGGNVIPEVPIGPIMVSVTMVIGLAGFVGFNRFRPKAQLQPK